MRILSILMPAIFLVANASAQTCKSDFFPYQKGLQYGYQNYDKKGKLSGRMENTVLDMTTAGDTLKAVVEALSIDPKGKEEHRTKVAFSCINGTLLMGLQSAMSSDLTSAITDSGGEVLIQGTPLEFPNTLTVGQELANGDLSISLLAGGKTIMGMKFNITNRKVVSKGKITVKSGTYEGYKITSDMNIKTIFSRDIKVEQWMVPGVGMVRSENFNKKGDSEGYMEMDLFKK